MEGYHVHQAKLQVSSLLNEARSLLQPARHRPTCAHGVGVGAVGGCDVQSSRLETRQQTTAARATASVREIRTHCRSRSNLTRAPEGAVEGASLEKDQNSPPAAAQKPKVKGNVTCCRHSKSIVTIGIENCQRVVQAIRSVARTRTHVFCGISDDAVQLHEQRVGGDQVERVPNTHTPLEQCGISASTCAHIIQGAAPRGVNNCRFINAELNETPGTYVGVSNESVSPVEARILNVRADKMWHSSPGTFKKKRTAEARSMCGYLQRICRDTRQARGLGTVPVHERRDKDCTVNPNQNLQKQSSWRQVFQKSNKREQASVCEEVRRYKAGAGHHYQ